MNKLLPAALLSLLTLSCSGRSAPSSADREASATAATALGNTALGENNTTARALPTAALPTAPLPRGVLRMQPAQVVDASGFERPMLAASVMVPAGWRAQGGMVWGTQGACGADYTLNWSLTAPDGLSAFAIVPLPNWQFVRSNIGLPAGPCPQERWSTAREFLEATARKYFPDARFVDYRNRPDLLKPVADLLAAMPLPQTDLVQGRMYADVGEIMVAHQVGGRDVRELIRATIMLTQTRTFDVLNPGQIAMEQLDGSAMRVIFMRAPAGQLDVGLPDVIEKSFRQSPEWSDRVFRHSQAKQQARFEAMMRQGKASLQQIESMRQQQQARTAASAEAKRIADGTYRDRDLLSDRLQRENIESIRGVETYHEPQTGGIVQLDNHYNHAWRVRDGTYLMTNDPNFQPGQVGLEGQLLRAVQ